VIEADEGAAQGQERLMDVHSPLGADRQAPIAVQPRQRPLDHPPVPSEALAGLDPLARDPDLDMAPVQEAPAAGDIIGLVGMQLGRAFAALPGWLPDAGHGVDQVLEDHAVVAVRAGQQRGQRNPAAFPDQMMFRAWFAAIGRVRSGLIAPLFAGTLALSRLARLQSMRPASPSRSRRVWWRRSQTPASCQSRSRRQQVTPEPQPISWGSISQGMPLLRTKMIPVKHARSGTRGRPPLGWGGAVGSSGATITQSSSGTRSFFIAMFYHIAPGYERHS